MPDLYLYNKYAHSVPANRIAAEYIQPFKNPQCNIESIIEPMIKIASIFTNE